MRRSWLAEDNPAVPRRFQRDFPRLNPKQSLLSLGGTATPAASARGFGATSPTPADCREAAEHPFRPIPVRIGCLILKPVGFRRLWLEVDGYTEVDTFLANADMIRFEQRGAVAFTCVAVPIEKHLLGRF